MDKPVSASLAVYDVFLIIADRGPRPRWRRCTYSCRPTRRYNSAGAHIHAGTIAQVHIVVHAGTIAQVHI